jgi:hypothetical protein
MRHPFLALVLACFGCGGIAAEPTPPGAPADDAETQPLPHAAGRVKSVTAVTPSFGEVYFQVTNKTTSNGQPTLAFGARLYYPGSVFSDTRCVGAERTVGSCCYIPTAPPAPRPTPGHPLITANAGTVSLVDATTGKDVGSLTYGPPSSGYGDGYPELVFIDVMEWSPGDLMTIGATGQTVGPFEASVRALAMPSWPAPSGIGGAKEVTFVWAPDPNAHTMTVTLEAFSDSKKVSHGTVACEIPDSTGTLTIDASLLAAFEAGDTCDGTLVRSAKVPVSTSTGPLTVSSEAVDFFRVPVF